MKKDLYSERRRREIRLGQERGKQPSYKELEREAREAGLQRPIDASNKGYQLLSKMGYVPEIHTDEPIMLHVRDTKSGLGVEEERQETIELNERKRKQTQEDYGVWVKRQYNEKRVERDIRQARLACHQLDQDHGVEENVLWPTPENVDELSKEEQLETLVKYLRDTYNYCIWCGVTYESLQDMEQDCPGKTYNDHE
jgi:hypothetical protein